MADTVAQTQAAADAAIAKIRKAQAAIDQATANIRKAQKKFEETKVRLEKMKAKAEQVAEKAKAAKQKIKDAKSAFKPKMAKVAGMAGMVATLVGILKAQLIIRVQQEVLKLLEKFMQQCPDPKDLQKAIKIKNNLLKNINSFQKRVDTFAKIAKTLLIAATTIKLIIKIITSIPAPTSVPPGVGIPISLLTKFSNTLVKVNKILDKFIAEAAAILLIVQAVSVIISRLKEKLGELDAKIERCTKNPLADPDSDEPVEVDITQVIQLSNLTQAQLSGLSSLTRAQLFEISNLTQAQLSGLSTTDLTQAQLSGLSNLTQAQLSGLSNLTQAQLSGLSTTNLTQAQLSGLPATQLAALSENTLTPAQQSALRIKAITDITQPKENTGSEGTPTDAAGNLDPNYSYKSKTTGKLYNLSIIQDPNSPKIAPRRYAIAKDLQGIIRLKGDLSFSSSTQILLDELKFRIDQLL